MIQNQFAIRSTYTNTTARFPIYTTNLLKLSLNSICMMIQSQFAIRSTSTNTTARFPIYTTNLLKLSLNSKWDFWPGVGLLGIQRLPCPVSFWCMFAGTALVENMAKKNRSRFPIAVLLTTLICSVTKRLQFFIFYFGTAKKID